MKTKENESVSARKNSASERRISSQEVSREERLDKLLDSGNSRKRSFGSMKFYYPGADEYLPTKVIAGKG